MVAVAAGDGGGGATFAQLGHGQAAKVFFIAVEPVVVAVHSVPSKTIQLNSATPKARQNAQGINDKECLLAVCEKAFCLSLRPLRALRLKKFSNFPSKKSR